MYALCKALKLKFSDVENIDTESVSKWLNVNSGKQDSSEARKAPLILDVREDEEYKISHLKEAVSVNPSATDEQICSVIKEHINKSSVNEPSAEKLDVVCYCSLGYRSSTLARKIKGLASAVDKPLNVYNLEGSLFKWANEGRPLVDGKGEQTRYVHPYNSVFGALLNSDRRKYKADD